MHPSKDEPKNLLVTLTGNDRPGVTAAMFAVFAAAGVAVLDIEQIVLRNRLVLGILVTAPRDWKKLRDAVFRAADDLGMNVEVEKGVGDNATRHRERSHITLLGTPLKASAVSAVAGRIADCGANIDRIERMARYPVTAIELHVSGAPAEVLRPLLTAEAKVQGIDLAVQKQSLHRRGIRLIVMDVDSTLIQGEVIEMIAAHAGCEDEVARVTEAAMRGEIDFEQSLRQRVALLEGVPASALDEVYDGIVLAPGARTLVRTLRRLGYRFAIVSGGFTHVTDRLAADLGIHFARANELEIVGAGEVDAEVGVPVDAVIAVGDGANDLDMLNAAGLGIAYNAKPLVRDAADTAVNVPYLDTILYLLGISRDEIEEADAEVGIVTPAPAL
jgi:phosphoserine phosphatase